MSDNRDYLIICNHCGVDVSIRRTGKNGVKCDHLYYPERCQTCLDVSAYEVVETRHDMSRITTIDKTRTFDQYLEEKS